MTVVTTGYPSTLQPFLLARILTTPASNQHSEKATSVWKIFYCPGLEMTTFSSYFLVLLLQLKSACPQSHVGCCSLYVYSKRLCLKWLGSRSNAKLEPGLRFLAPHAITKAAKIFRTIKKREGVEKAPFCPGAKILNCNKTKLSLSLEGTEKC